MQLLKSEKIVLNESIKLDSGKLIQKCEDGLNVKKVLKYPTIISGFQRLN